MQKEVIWVFGTSASGKETFIKKVIDDSLFRQDYGWVDKKVSHAPSSVEYIGQFENDPVIQKRENIIAEVQELIKDNDTVLIKWQFVDSDVNGLYELKKEIPEAVHKIITLQVSDEELGKRLIKKSWWQEDWSIDEWISEEKDLIQKEIQKYQNDFEIMKVLE